MGYSTFFTGKFGISPALTVKQRDYLRAFSDTRRVTRNPRLLAGLPDPLREAVGLPLGPDGCYFVGVGPSPHGERHKQSIADGNRPPADQPGLWCQWEPNERGTSLAWNESDNFYNYVEWLEYVIAQFLEPWGRTITGQVRWQGDDDADTGTINVAANEIDVLGPIVVRRGKSIRRLRVFLCHASEDKRKVRALHRRLTDDNVDAWIDEERLLPGSDWDREIRNALRDSDAVILCLSTMSVRKRGFIQREVRIVQRVAEEEPEGELFLFPVRLSSCAVPDSLRHLQRIDLHRRGAYAHLLAGLDARAQALSSRRPRSSHGRSNPRVESDAIARVAHARLTRTRYAP